MPHRGIEQQRPEVGGQVEAVAALPQIWIQNGAPVETWQPGDWTDWLKEVYRNLKISPREHIATFNDRVKVGMGILIEQFYEGMKAFRDVAAPEAVSRRQKAPLLPTLHIAIGTSMHHEDFGVERSTWNFLGDNQVFINVEDIGTIAGKRDLSAFVDHEAIIGKGVMAVMHKASMKGRFLFDGVEQMAHTFFLSEYQTYGDLNHSQSLAQYDSQPMAMFALLADIAVATAFLDTLFEKYRSKRGNEDISQETVAYLMQRMYQGWELMPREWQKKLQGFREKVEQAYTTSYANRLGKTQSQAA